MGSGLAGWFPDKGQSRHAAVYVYHRHWDQYHLKDQRARVPFPQLHLAVFDNVPNIRWQFGQQWERLLATELTLTGPVKFFVFFRE